MNDTLTSVVRISAVLAGSCFSLAAAAQGSDGQRGLQAAEAFIDNAATPPGAGTPLPLQEAITRPINTALGSLPTGALTQGPHTVFVRFQDEDGVWGPAIAHTVVTTPEGGGPPAAAQVAVQLGRAGITARPTVDVTNGVGTLGDSALFRFDDAVSTQGLEPGLYQLRLRANDSEGTSGPTIRMVFLFNDNDGDFIEDSADPDDDNDGMSDVFENTHGLNPFDPSDAGDDPDGDGLTNLEEFNAGTNPTEVDSDGDGLHDGIDLQPAEASTLCGGANAFFSNELVRSGSVVQCGATSSIRVSGSVIIEGGAQVEFLAPEVELDDGVSVPQGAIISVEPIDPSMP
jgi:hypothetical protein